MTNGDKIRQMTDDELAEWIDNLTDCCAARWICDKCPINTGGCCDKEKFIEWLKQEAEDANSD